MELKSAACAVAFAACLPGCAVHMSHGTQVTEAQVSSFQVGSTTLEQVVAVLGKPSWTSVQPNGTKFVGYVVVFNRINPPSFETMTGISPRTETEGTAHTLFKFDIDSKLMRVERWQTDTPKTEAK